MNLTSGALPPRPTRLSLIQWERQGCDRKRDSTDKRRRRLYPRHLQCLEDVEATEEGNVEPVFEEKGTGPRRSASDIQRHPVRTITVLTYWTDSLRRDCLRSCYPAASSSMTASLRHW